MFLRGSLLRLALRFFARGHAKTHCFRRSEAVPGAGRSAAIAFACQLCVLLRSETSKESDSRHFQFSRSDGPGRAHHQGGQEPWRYRADKVREISPNATLSAARFCSVDTRRSVLANAVAFVS